MPVGVCTHHRFRKDLISEIQVDDESEFVGHLNFERSFRRLLIDHPDWYLPQQPSLRRPQNIGGGYLEPPLSLLKIHRRSRSQFIAGFRGISPITPELFRKFITRRVRGRI